MFARMHRPSAAAYHAVEIESAVHHTDPHRLVEMLFDGAVTAVMKAGMALKQGNFAAKGESTSKAIRIIDEGLKDLRSSWARITGSLTGQNPMPTA